MTSDEDREEDGVRRYTPVSRLVRDFARLATLGYELNPKLLQCDTEDSEQVLKAIHVMKLANIDPKTCDLNDDDSVKSTMKQVAAERRKTIRELKQVWNQLGQSTRPTASMQLALDKTNEGRNGKRNTDVYKWVVENINTEQRYDFTQLFIDTIWLEYIFRTSSKTSTDHSLAEADRDDHLIVIASMWGQMTEPDGFDPTKQPIPIKVMTERQQVMFKQYVARYFLRFDGLVRDCMESIFEKLCEMPHEHPLTKGEVGKAWRGINRRRVWRDRQRKVWGEVPVGVAKTPIDVFFSSPSSFVRIQPVRERIPPTVPETQKPVRVDIRVLGSLLKHYSEAQQDNA